MSDEVGRRQYLRVVGAAGFATLAGCFGQSASDSTTESGPTDTETATNTATATQTGTATATETVTETETETPTPEPPDGVVQTLEAGENSWTQEALVYDEEGDTQVNVPNPIELHQQQWEQRTSESELDWQLWKRALTEDTGQIRKGEGYLLHSYPDTGLTGSRIDGTYVEDAFEGSESVHEALDYMHEFAYWFQVRGEASNRNRLEFAMPDKSPFFGTVMEEGVKETEGMSAEHPGFFVPVEMWGKRPKWTISESKQTGQNSRMADVG